MSSSIFITLATLGLTQAYTVISAKSAFMTKNIDPIVFPGSYNQSHLHSFFGSDAVTANTKTSSQLMNGCTNMENPNDLSVYWVPTPLYTKDNGKTYQPIPFSRFSAYYNLGEAPAEIPFPANLAMVAGNAKGKTQADVIPGSKVEWFCEGGPSSPLDANGFPLKTCSTHLQQLLYFPSCVNPTTLTYAYKSRTYGTANWCPKDMKAISQLRFSIRYDLRKVLPNGWSETAPFKLASGNAWSSHGDFINGWTDEANQSLLASTKDKRTFFAVEGKRGGYKDYANCKTKDAEPSKGTSDSAESVKAMSKRAVDAAGWFSRSRFLRDSDQGSV